MTMNSMQISVPISTEKPEFSRENSWEVRKRWAGQEGRERGAEDAAGGILAERWPTLAGAMSRYKQNVAESFTTMAYECVQAGIIRLDDRRKLAAEAAALGIRDFDAQLLMACAVRQWSLDRHYDPEPTREAPALSFEYKSWNKAWLRFAIVVGAALSIDLVLILKWLS